MALLYHRLSDAVYGSHDAHVPLAKLHCMARMMLMYQGLTDAV